MRSALALGLALCLGGAAGAAQATVINSTFNITIWHATCTTNCGSGNALEQATNTNTTMMNAANLVGNYSYTGELNFSASGSNTYNNISYFLNSGGGSLGYMSGTSLAGLSGIDLSKSGFTDTTLFKITGSTSNPISGTVKHDDGASLYQGGATVFNSQNPTNAIDTPYSLGVGAFQLYYVEANGLPAVLKMDVAAVPEPSSLALMAFSLLGLGLVIRRKRSAS